jgi:hypothetical protein
VNRGTVRPVAGAGLICLLLFATVRELGNEASVNLVSLSVARTSLVSHAGLMSLAEIPGLPRGSWGASSQAPFRPFDWLGRAVASEPGHGSRIRGVSSLLGARPVDAARWLEPYVNRYPTDVVARLAFGHAQYSLRQGTKAAQQYQYVYDTFERACCDSSYEYGLRHRWSELLRRIKEAQLIDAWYSPDSFAKADVARLEQQSAVWPHEVMRLYRLLELYEGSGTRPEAQRTRDELRFSDFEAYGLSEAFPSVMDRLTADGIWSPEMRRRAELAFEWDMRASEPTRVLSLSSTGPSPRSVDKASHNPNLLPPLPEWGTIVYASQPNLTPAASYRFRLNCTSAHECTGAVLGLWQRQPVSGQQTARAGWMSPVFAPRPLVTYQLSFEYCTDMGDVEDAPVLAVYIERASTFPLDYRLGSTRGRWRSYSTRLTFTAAESREKLRLWLGSFGNGVVFLNSPKLQQVTE